jgi:hypothetical protein
MDTGRILTADERARINALLDMIRLDQDIDQHKISDDTYQAEMTCIRTVLSPEFVSFAAGWLASDTGNLDRARRVIACTQQIFKVHFYDLLVSLHRTFLAKQAAPVQINPQALANSLAKVTGAREVTVNYDKVDAAGVVVSRESATSNADDDLQWCSIYGYDIPPKHACIVGICFNPSRDGQQWTSESRQAARNAHAASFSGE